MHVYVCVRECGQDGRNNVVSYGTDECLANWNKQGRLTSPRQLRFRVNVCRVVKEVFFSADS